MILPPVEIEIPGGLSVQDYLNELVSFVHKYEHLIEMHVVNFMTFDYWGKLDPEWQKALLPRDGQDNDSWMAMLLHLAAEYACPEDAPESMQEFVRTLKFLSLNRQPSASSRDYKCNVGKVLRHGMTVKKIHEVERMSFLVKETAARSNVSSVMDLGAGQGYLSRTAAFLHGLNVLAVDSNEIQTCGAKKFDKHTLKGLANALQGENGKVNSNKNGKIHHVTDTVTPENVSQILNMWSHRRDEQWLVCGLHACGDLTSLMLRLFIQSDKMASLVNVGCCYNFLSEQNGFPMSFHVKSELQFRLSPTARMLACQSPARWVDRKEETVASLEHHYFRALLQYIMVEKGLADRLNAPVLGRFNKKKDFDSFPVYVKKALKRLKIPEDSISPEEAEEYYQKFKDAQVDKQITALWTLRVLFAPILESIVLVDRYLYIKESLAHLPPSSTKGVWLYPLFDPVISPRNIVVVASK